MLKPSVEKQGVIARKQRSVKMPETSYQRTQWQASAGQGELAEEEGVRDEFRKVTGISHKRFIDHCDPEYQDMPGILLHGRPVRFCLCLACVLFLWNTASGIKREVKKEKGMAFLPTTGKQAEERKEKGMAFLATTELPARSVDLSALNLTELVNGMLNRALKDTKKFFSLLSITSYSSFAFHKFSVAIYNISNLKKVDPAKFPTRHCYCLDNQTNDLSDFTALLVDIIGNSTSYLTEIFKSTSILSVSQTDDSDCIFICVMTGKSGRNLSDFWEMAEKSPVINYTFTSSVSGVLGAATRGTAGTPDPKTKSQQTLLNASSPHWAHSTYQPSLLKTSRWIETTAPSEGEEPKSTDRLPELPEVTTATGSNATHSTPASATRRVAGTPWMTASRQTRASTVSMPWIQTLSEKSPGAPLWKTRSSTPMSPEGAKEVMSAGSLWGFPVGIMTMTGSPSQTSPTLGTFTPGTQTPSPTKAPAPKDPQTGDLPAEWSFTPGREPALTLGPYQVSRCPELLFKEGAMTAAPLPMAIQKLNPCLMELCRFFQQCLCMSQRRNSRTQAMRYCLEYYSWFLKNATYICQRVKRVYHSHTLKQKCLENVCKSV
ncbi:HERV-H LTR-associating protein 1 [Tupaia chinensis]|uniref:HERV-H LTR-associating protein 1 n=1 Tax=Tupaia chinensis TaxID=246437 RepID=UPI0003C8EC17|nr:HERV-H LTR-associating protein 1 [Tupaia chinensis]